MVVLILAASEGRWWDWPDGPGRHLVPIAGEPLIVRTVRQCKERGFDAIVVTHLESVMSVVPRSFVPERHKWWCETVFYTKPLWDDRTVALMGDLVYPDGLLDAIFNDHGSPRVYGKRHGDFDVAVAFDREHWPQVDVALQLALDDVEERNATLKPGEIIWHHGCTGQFMRALCGFNLYEPPPDGCPYMKIVDVGWAKDFDKPGQYKAWLQENEWARQSS